MIGIKSAVKSLHVTAGHLAIIVSTDEPLIFYLKNSLSGEGLRVV